MYVQVRPNVPLDTQFAMQHILHASDVDHNVYPGVHQLYDSDPLSFILIAPLWVREIIDSIGENEAIRMWGPGGTQDERRALIREYLARAPAQGGYRDFMRHYCPHRHREVDPDFVADECGEFAAKHTFERFLERTVSDVERVMFLPDEGVLPELSVPQTDIEANLRSSIADLQRRETAARASGAVSLKIQALRRQLICVQNDRERVQRRIRASRRAPAKLPAPLGWITAREALADRPGVHSGRGYCDFVRQWALAATRRRARVWGPLLEYDGI